MLKLVTFQDWAENKTANLKRWKIWKMLKNKELLIIRPVNGTGKHTGKENKHLVGGVVIVCHQHCKICAPGTTFTWFVSKLTLELVQSLVQFVLGHQIASIMAELWASKSDNEFILIYSKVTLVLLIRDVVKKAGGNWAIHHEFRETWTFPFQKEHLSPG